MLARAGLACAFVVFPVFRLQSALHLHQQDSKIEKATRAIEAAQTDAERAEAYVARGVALGEKARYSRAFKLVPDDEYARLLARSLKDHDQAIALGPGVADIFHRRGLTYLLYARYLSRGI